MHLNNFEFNADFYVLNIGDVDMVLRMTWLHDIDCVLMPIHEEQRKHVYHLDIQQLRQFVLVFVYNKLWRENILHLGTSLGIHSKETLHVKEFKCELGSREMLYLGDLISTQGVCMDLDKVKEIIEWPTPERLIQLRGILGSCGFYCKLVNGYSRHATPLSDLTKKGYLRNYIARQQKGWVKWICLCQYCNNTTYHLSIQMTLFMVL